MTNALDLWLLGIAGRGKPGARFGGENHLTDRLAIAMEYGIAGARLSMVSRDLFALRVVSMMELNFDGVG